MRASPITRMRSVDPEQRVLSGLYCICQNSKKYLSQAHLEFLVDAHHRIIESGKCNFQECRIPIYSKLNVNYIPSWLTDFKDQTLCDLLEFGFPVGFNGDQSLFENTESSHLWKFKNHKGAQDFPSEINAYLLKESMYKAIGGPFKENPFKNGIKISPLNSVPKKDQSERRIILDLSFPKGSAVNEFINKDTYLDEQMEVVYPKVDDFIQIIKQKGRNCLLFKRDLKRAFRQIPLDPSSYSLVAYSWRKHIFFDTFLTMGLTSASYICQRVTNAIAFIMFKIGILILNYLDDFASAETSDRAEFAYQTLGTILEKCGIEESKEKACPPSTIMTFVGVLFNTETLTIEITPERLEEIKLLVKCWLSKTKATLKEVQSLLGKLNFVASCVRSSRIFISRLLQWLRCLYKGNCKEYQIPEYVKKDLLWWDTFLPLYNGISMMIMEEWSEPDEIFSCDSCLFSCGGFWQGSYFHVKFPDEILDKQYHITILEMLTILVSLKLWSRHFKGKRIQIFCDNLPVCTLITSGKTNCSILQCCLRELAFITAMNEFQVRPIHLDSRSNRISDHLSRWDFSECHQKQFFELTRDYILTEYKVTPDMFNFINSW